MITNPRLPSVSIHYLNIINNALKRMGYLCGELDELTSKYKEEEFYFNRVPLQTLIDTWQTAELMSTDNIIGLHVGEKIHPLDYGLLGQIMMNCQTIGEALDDTLAAEFVINNIFTSEIIVENDNAINRIYCHQYEAEEIRHIVEQDISALINIGVFVMNNDYTDEIRPIEIHFRHKAAADVCEYERILKTKVLFEQEFNQAIYPLAIVNAPIYNPNPRVADLLKVELQKLLSEIENADGMTLRMWRFFQSQPMSASIDMEQVAKHFNITARTLQRRLQQEDSSFQDELKIFKALQAKQLLDNTSRSISETAYQLGFNDNSAFHKAFKRWTGMTPKEYQCLAK